MPKHLFEEIKSKELFDWLVDNQDLYDISFSMQVGLNNYDVPFGGSHVILAGDFYQMKNISGCPICCDPKDISNKEARIGRAIFKNRLTHFINLTKNIRASAPGGDGQLTPLAKFLSKVRLGRAPPDILAIANSKVVNNIEAAMKISHPNAIWITSTHQKIWEINKICQQKLQSQGARVTRIIANHIPSRIGVIHPDARIRDELYSVTGDMKGTKYTPMMTHIDLCIGTRVRLIRQISVERGLYNGAMGTVYGFVYKGSGPDKVSDTSDATIKFCDLQDDRREIPIVLVQMDGQDYPHSCSNEVPRLIPIVAVVGDSNIKTDYKRILPFYQLTQGQPIAYKDIPHMMVL